jgi:hypothetical protein
MNAKSKALASIKVSSNSYTTIILGILYILYGVVKIVIGLLIMMLSAEEISKIPILKMFSKEAEDKTLAGRMYEYVLMAFGVFTIVHGLIIFKLLPLWFEELFVHKTVQYGSLIIFGLIMTIFYALVLYTDLPIDKSTKDTDHYLTLGFVGGITFLLMPVIWELIEFSSPFFKSLSLEQQNLLIIASIVVITVIAEIIYMIVQGASEESSIKKIAESKIHQVTDVAEVATNIKAEL